MTQLNSAREVIEKLGGIDAVAALTERKPKAVTNWPLFNKFPANTFLAIRDALQAQGCTAPASLWNMIRSKKRRMS